MPALRQKVRLEYELDGAPKDVEVEYSAIDVRAWEADSGKSALTEDTSFSMLTWIAHHAAIRQGLLNGDLKAYKAFDQTCTNVEAVREDPTVPAARGRATRKTPGASSSAD